MVGRRHFILDCIRLCMCCDHSFFNFNFFCLAVFLVLGWPLNHGCSCRHGPATPCYAVQFPATSCNALLRHELLQLLFIVVVQLSLLWLLLPLFITPPTGTVRHRLPRAWVCPRFLPEREVFLATVALNACSWGNYCNCWVFVNYRVWSRPTLSVKCLEITLVMNWYFK